LHFENIDKGDTPFTLENVNHIKTIAIMLIITIVLPILPELIFRWLLQMPGELVLKNHLKELRSERKLSQSDLAEMVGVSRNTISSIETGQYEPTAKLAFVICIALDKKFEDVFYF